MKLNKFLLIGIFLLIIVSFGAVDAADYSSVEDTLINNGNGDLENIDYVSIDSNSDELRIDGDSAIDSTGSYINLDDENAGSNYLRGAEKQDESIKREFSNDILEDNSDSLLNTQIRVNGTNITDGDNATIKVLLTLEDGLVFSAPVVINVNGINVTNVNTSNNWKNIDISPVNLIIGANVVIVYYDGDETHNPSNASAIINVEKNKKVTANVEVANAVYGDPVVLKISNLSDAYGNLLSVFGGYQLVGPEHPYGSMMVRKGKCTTNFNNLPAGNYSVYIVFGNNIGGNYDFENYIVDFIVEKAPVILSANIADYKYGKEGNLEVKVTDMKNKPISGKINVTIDDEKYASDVVVTNGEAKISLENITIDNHTAKIEFDADNYIQTNVTTQFNVLSRDNSTYLIAENLTMTYKDGSNWVVTLIDDYEKGISGAIVKFCINGTFYDVGTDLNGVASLPIDLNPGTYKVNASFSGDGYDDAFSEAIVIVVKAVPSINISADNINYGDVLVVDVVLPGDAVGGVNVSVGDETKFVSLTEGVGSAEFTGLAAGTYVVNVDFLGDDNYIESTSSFNAKINRAVPVIQVSANDINYGEILVVDVELSSDVSRRAVVDVDGMSKFVTLKEGKGTVKFSRVHAGNQTVVVSYNGDVNYGVASVSSSVIVSRGVADIKVSASPVSYGDVLVVDVVLPGDAVGGVNVSVGDETKFVSLTEGVGSAEFTGLATGSHSVNVAYAGDDNYMESTSSFNAKINRAVPVIQVSANDINYGEILVVDVELSSDVSRRAVVSVDGESKYVTLKEGKGQVRFDGLSIGSHNVVVSYNGDVNYGVASVSSSVIVSRGVADIKVSASPVSYGDVLVVDVVLPGDAVGGVNVSIGDETIFVDLTDGVGSVEFTDLTVGTHEINVAYGGDDNYMESDVSINAKINRATPEIRVIANDINYGETLTVEVQLPSDVTRRTIVTIGNETKYVSLKEGIGSVKFTGLGVGSHDIAVVYNGDSNYLKSSVNSIIEVNSLA